MFYWNHRFLHLKQVYPYIHKIHHQHKVTIALAAVYTHPIEFILGNLLPMAAGPMILGSHMHITAVFMWYGLRTMSTLDGHSGYEFSWSPFNHLQMCDSGYHSYHHLHNIGNYSSFFSCWDTLMGTNKAYHAFLKEKTKVE